MEKNGSAEKTLSEDTQTIQSRLSQEYKYGFITEIDQETIPPGLNEEVVKIISMILSCLTWVILRCCIALKTI